MRRFRKKPTVDTLLLELVRSRKTADRRVNTLIGLGGRRLRDGVKFLSATTSGSKVAAASRSRQNLVLWDGRPAQQTPRLF